MNNNNAPAMMDEFSIMELEDRLEMSTRCSYNNNCSCPAPTPTSPTAPAPSTTIKQS